MTQIVCLSGKRRTGKTTLANIMREEKNFRPVSLAGPLKLLCRAQFGFIYDQTDSVLKESPTQFKDPKTGRYWTPRDVMIHIGKTYRAVDVNFWVNKVKEEMALAPNLTYVISDVRFLNELEQFKALGALCVRLERDEALTGPAIKDESETELDAYKEWDIIIPAGFNRTIDDLYNAAGVIYAHLETH